MKPNRRKGLSLIELVLVMVLMSMVIALCVSLISLTVKGVTSSDQILTTAMSDAEFAAKVNDAIRKSTTSFTIPHDSFNEIGADGQPNLTWTAQWSYLGLLDHVHIPAGASRTGREISDASALVFLEWIGDRYPEAGEYDTNVVNIIDRRDDGNGVFIEHIIAHDYTDLSGVRHHYQLVFEPTDASLKAPQAITWRLTATADYGEDQGVTSFETMMQAVNAVQVVYQGSAANPAVALAFRSDFKPTDGQVVVTENRVKGTVCLLLDCSGSMTSNKVNGVMRMDIMKEAAKNFIHQLAQNPDLNMLLAPYGTVVFDMDYLTGTSGICQKALVTTGVPEGGSLPSTWRPCMNIVNISENEEWLIQTIESLVGTGSTNTGDGMRYIWYKLSEDAASAASLVGDDSIMVISLSDGEMCEWCMDPIVTRIYKSNATGGDDQVGANITSTYYAAVTLARHQNQPYYFPANYQDHYFYGTTRETPFSYQAYDSNNNYLGTFTSPGYYLSGNSRIKYDKAQYHYGYLDSPSDKCYDYLTYCANKVEQDFRYVYDSQGHSHERLTMIAAPMFNSTRWTESNANAMTNAGVNLQFTNMSGGTYTSGTRYFGLSYTAVNSFRNGGFEISEVTLSNLTDFDRFFAQAISRITENMWAYTGPET